MDAQKDPNRGGSQNPGSPCPGANHSALGAGPKSVSSSCLDGDMLLRAQHPKKTGVPRSPEEPRLPGPCLRLPVCEGRIRASRTVARRGPEAKPGVAGESEAGFGFVFKNK